LLLVEVGLQPVQFVVVMVQVRQLPVHMHTPLLLTFWLPQLLTHGPKAYNRE